MRENWLLWWSTVAWRVKIKFSEQMIYLCLLVFHSIIFDRVLMFVLFLARNWHFFIWIRDNRYYFLFVCGSMLFSVYLWAHLFSQAQNFVFVHFEVVKMWVTFFCWRSIQMASPDDIEFVVFYCTALILSLCVRLIAAKLICHSNFIFIS